MTTNEHHEPPTPAELERLRPLLNLSVSEVSALANLASGISTMSSLRRAGIGALAMLGAVAATVGSVWALAQTLGSRHQ